MNAFQEDKFYVMSPPGERWSDYDGPFDTQDEAVSHLRLFINEERTFSPEMLEMVIVHFKNNRLELVKADDGSPLNGKYLFWKLGSIV